MIFWDIAPPPPPPVKQDTTYTKHVYRHTLFLVWEWGLVSKGGTMLHRQNIECGYLIEVVLYIVAPPKFEDPLNSRSLLRALLA